MTFPMPGSMVMPMASPAQPFRPNPNATTPAPPPPGSRTPAQVWTASPQLTWTTAGLPTGVYARAIWGTPVFDLRPELAGILPGVGAGRSIGGAAIWLPRGAAGKLWVQVNNLTSTDWGLTGLRVLATEYAHPTDSNELQAITDPTDITTEFVGTAPAALGSFIPPGSGYPPRFWRLSLQFDFLQDSSAKPEWPNPGYLLTAAYY